MGREEKREDGRRIVFGDIVQIGITEVKKRNVGSHSSQLPVAFIITTLSCEEISLSVWCEAVHFSLSPSIKASYQKGLDCHQVIFEQHRKVVSGT